MFRISIKQIIVYCATLNGCFYFVSCKPPGNSSQSNLKGSAKDLMGDYQPDKSIFDPKQKLGRISEYGLDLFEDPDCKITNDPFEFGARVSKIEFAKTPKTDPWNDSRKLKPFIQIGAREKIDRNPASANDCINTYMDRPAVKLSASDQKIIFANFRYSDYEFVANVETKFGFYTAAFPINSIGAMYYLVVQNDFLKWEVGTHAQILILFDRPVRMKPQIGTIGPNTLEESAFILSIQSADPVKLGNKSSIFDGSRLLAFTAQTIFRKGYEDFISVYQVKNMLAQKIEFSRKSQYQEYLSAYLRNGSKKLSKYFLINVIAIEDNQSCNIEQFKIIDRIIGHKENIFDFFTNPPAIIGKAAPNLSIRALRKRGLAKSPPIKIDTFESLLQLGK